MRSYTARPAATDRRPAWLTIPSMIRWFDQYVTLASGPLTARTITPV